MEHIEFEKLVSNFERGIEGPLPADVSTHLDGCPQCSLEFRRLADFFSYVTPDILEDVPQAATARILNIYQRRPIPDAAPVKKAAGLGFLVFDDWAMAVNERHSGIGSRQMLYRVDGYDIDLRIEFAADKCSLAGQILPGIDEATVSLSSSTSSCTVQIGEFGEFEFEQVEAGTYSLVISGDNEVLVIKELRLRQ